MADPGKPAGDLVFCKAATVEEITAFIAELDAEEQDGTRRRARPSHRRHADRPLRNPRLAAEARAAEAANTADELRERERTLAEAGFFARQRMIRELRRQPA